MKLVTKKDNLSDYLGSSKVIDYEEDIIQKTTRDLLANSKNSKNEISKAKTIYEFVRDEVSHSSDIGSNEVTCRASDVLKKGHGLCFAKSHLLAAMLRSEGIPTGLCYQKLSTDEGPMVHGLNAVFLDGQWHRLDARGNKKGINAQFSLNGEKLAYIPKKEKGDVDYPYIHNDPPHYILKILTKYKTLDEAIRQIVGSV